MDTLQIGQMKRKCWQILHDTNAEKCFMIADNYCQRYLIRDVHMYVHSQCTLGL